MARFKKLDNMIYYKQCRLVKHAATQVAWIPEIFAVIGKYLRLGDDNGWRVSSIGGRMESGYLFRHNRDYLTQRRASDI